ncbi:E3 ubiquitin/ISG15 ligase TRIM25-like [Alosa pseudoharengus]|uniref:E3 ubiquitin/ISG15 ligase TRIM25-like n=1 Tax=Alosa pseudoharengus TaxID=34774 RepID=UPI003F8CAA21
MAGFSSVLSQDQITCSVCLDLLDDPVTIPCGHTYCFGCIKRCWDDDKGDVYRCPYCRVVYSERPALNKNTMFAEVVEKLRETGLQPVSAEPAYPGPEDASCDVCTGRKLKATQSCLTCLASYCELHFNLHNELNAGNKHRVVSATTKLQESICTAHGKLLEVYCCTDYQFICCLCAMDDTHKSHETISVVGSADKQRLLGVAQKKSLESVQRKEMQAQDLGKATDSLKESAQTCVADCERVFGELIGSAERICSKVTNVIRAQEEAELRRAAALLERLDKESREMKERAAEMDKLSDTDDHINFIQSFQPLCGPAVSEDPSSMVINTRCSFGNLRESISDLQKQLQEICKQAMEKISKGDHVSTHKTDDGKGWQGKDKVPREHESEGEMAPCRNEPQWRRQNSEEQAPTHQTPSAPWRRRAASEEPARQDPGWALPPWRKKQSEWRAREASPGDRGQRRSRTQNPWRQQSRRREWQEEGSTWKQ